ncbi:cutinase family protein [Streptomyces sp. NBC_00386]|uniref:cutinase family protein n=1 Tax=Streptomyces sp. NBC_00386 TaxID=2975734 RepID=UPI002E22F11D
MRPQPETCATHTIARGDTLWDIAAKNLGDPTKWTALYEASQSVIEAAARTYGHATSDHGNLIFPGTRLSVPGGTCHPETRQPAPTAQQSAQIAQQNRVEHIPASCSKPLMIGVRGSGQTPEVEGHPEIPRDLGPEIGGVYENLAPLGVQVYGLPYPAKKVEEIAADSAEKLFFDLVRNGGVTVNGVALTAAEVVKNGFPIPDSVREGAANLEADLLAQVRACHGQNQKIVLAGYSQGNWVIRVALDAFKRDHPDEWPDIVSSISGIGLVADPYNPLARPSLPAELDKGQTIRACLPDDAVCNDPFTVPTGDVNCIITFSILCPHVRYGTEPTVPRSEKSAILEISSSLQLGLLSPKIPGAVGVPSNPLQ